MSEHIDPVLWKAFRDCITWSVIDDDAVTRLARASTVRDFGAGEVVYRRGAPTDTFALVIEGHLVSREVDASGRTHSYFSAWPGQSIGAMGALIETPWVMTLVAAEDSRIAIIPSRALAEEIERNHELPLELACEYARRFLFLFSALRNASCPVPVRVARYLLDRYVERGDATTRYADLRMSRSDLASALQTTPESLSRAFSALQRSGVIDSDGGRTVAVLDEAQLREAAGEPSDI